MVTCDLCGRPMDEPRINLDWRSDSGDKFEVHFCTFLCVVRYLKAWFPDQIKAAE